MRVRGGGFSEAGVMRAVEYIELPASLEYVGDYAFASAVNVESIVVRKAPSKGVDTLDEEMNKRKYNINAVELGDGVFDGSKVSEVYLPNVRSLGLDVEYWNSDEEYWAVEHDAPFRGSEIKLVDAPNVVSITDCAFYELDDNDLIQLIVPSITKAEQIGKLEGMSNEVVVLVVNEAAEDDSRFTSNTVIKCVLRASKGGGLSFKVFTEDQLLDALAIDGARVVLGANIGSVGSPVKKAIFGDGTSFDFGNYKCIFANDEEIWPLAKESNKIVNKVTIGSLTSTEEDEDYEIRRSQFENAILVPNAVINVKSDIVFDGRITVDRAVNIIGNGNTFTFGSLEKSDDPVFYFDFRNNLFGGEEEYSLASITNLKIVSNDENDRYTLVADGNVQLTLSKVAVTGYRTGVVSWGVPTNVSAINASKIILDKDCSVTVTKVISDSPSYYESALYASAGGKFVINGGTYQGYHALYLSSSGWDVDINGGKFYGKYYEDNDAPTAVKGYALKFATGSEEGYATNGLLNVYDGQFYGRVELEEAGGRKGSEDLRINFHGGSFDSATFAEDLTTNLIGYGEDQIGYLFYSGSYKCVAGQYNASKALLAGYLANGYEFKANGIEETATSYYVKSM